MLQGPGENAGAVDIGGGLAVVLKMESHNHPSAVEPFEGAATGVGGILRDIFTMGARPIALLDSLRFGPPEGRSAYLTRGVVAGISAYGNCVGVPTVGGEVFFHPSFAENPLVNVMCVGLVEHHRLTRASAGETGDLVVLVGALTGRDGIHGATFASVEMDEGWEERRPAVQVGNPFLEKLLLEACLEILERDIVSGMQDLGAAGLTSSCAEMAARGDRGITIDVARVPRREQHMVPYEVMLSESQERMILVVPPSAIDAVREHFQRWELAVSVIGRVTDDGQFRVLDDGAEAACLPVGLLTDDAPSYTHPLIPMAEAAGASASHGPGGRQHRAARADCIRAIFAVASRSSASMITRSRPTPSLVRDGCGGAASEGNRSGTGDYDRWESSVLPRQPEARRSDCRGRIGAKPRLSGRSPDRRHRLFEFWQSRAPEPYWAMSEAIDGIAEACLALDVPVVSGNVSLYNETRGARSLRAQSLVWWASSMTCSQALPVGSRRMAMRCC